MGNACDDTKAVFTGVARTLLLLALSSSGIFKYTTTPASSTTPSNKGDKDNREDITFPIGKKVSHHVFFKTFRILKYTKSAYDSSQAPLYVKIVYCVIIVSCVIFA